MTGRFPALVGDRGKTIHQPQGCSAVAIIRHEGEPLGIGDEVARQPDGADECTMRRLLVVEMEAVVRVPDGVDAFVECGPLIIAACRSREFPGRIVGRRDRVLRKGMVIDRKQEMLFVLLEQTPSERQRVQRTLKLLVYEALAH